MKSYKRCKNAKSRAFINVVVAIASIAVLAPQVHSTGPDASTAGSSPAAAVSRQTSARPGKSSASPQKSPGIKIYIDPKTGEISQHPPQLAPPPAQQKSLEGAKEPQLQQIPSPRPGGGVMVDLKGRFRSSLRAKRDVDGKLSIKHGSETANVE